MRVDPGEWARSPKGRGRWRACATHHNGRPATAANGCAWAKRLHGDVAAGRGGGACRGALDVVRRSAEGRCGKPMREFMVPIRIVPAMPGSDVAPECERAKRALPSRRSLLCPFSIGLSRWAPGDPLSSLAFAWTSACAFAGSIAATQATCPTVPPNVLRQKKAPCLPVLGPTDVLKGNRHARLETCGAK